MGWVNALTGGGNDHFLLVNSLVFLVSISCQIACIARLTHSSHLKKTKTNNSKHNVRDVLCVNESGRVSYRSLSGRSSLIDGLWNYTPYASREKGGGVVLSPFSF